MSTPRVMIATPRFDDLVHCDSFMSVRHADMNEIHDPEDRVEVVYNIGNKASLLTFCFNGMFAEALNKRDEGEVDLFCMVHADVIPQAGFLNHLWNIMRTRGDIVVSSVISIKEPKKLKTSTAVGCRSDKFGVKRYIQTTDRLRTPETFSTKDIAQEDDDVLLINTGLMLVDLSWSGWENFAFGFDDVIKRNPVTGKREAHCNPEDWRMSRHLDELGVPYSATWRLPVKHAGPGLWNSHEIPMESSVEAKK